MSMQTHALRVRAIGAPALLFACLFLFLTILLAAGAARAQTRTVVLCYEEVDVTPWRTIQGTGLNFDLLRMVAKRLDLNLRFQTLPWKRCFAQLKTNEVSGAFAASFKPDRLEMGAYPGGRVADPSKRLYIDRYVLIRRKGSKVDFDARRIHNLDGAVGIQLGYSIGDQLREMGVPVDEGSQRARELVQKLLAGRVGAIALGGGETNSVLHDPTLAAYIEVLPTPLVEKPYYLMLSQAFVAADPALAAKIWKTIEDVRNSPAYKKLEREAIEKSMR